MVTELVKRIRRLRIRHSTEHISGNIYATCPHWWAWWIPNTLPVWNFYDDEGNIHSCSITYGTEPTIITSSGNIIGGIWFGAPDVYLVHGQELDNKTKNAERPTLFVLYEHRVDTEQLAYPSGTTSALLIMPQSAKWSAELSSSMHRGMMSAIQDIMKRAFVDIIDATWVPTYNSNLAGTGQGLPGEANSLVMTLRWRSYS
jgi:hypothetical protein